MHYADVRALNSDTDALRRSNTLMQIWTQATADLVDEDFNLNMFDMKRILRRRRHRP